MIDRNLQVAYLIVDEMHHDHPELLKDQYWDSVLTTELPYTVASMNNREEPPAASTANIEVKADKAEIIPMVPSSIKIDDMVGKNTMNYEFPQNDIDSDKVRRIPKIEFLPFSSEAAMLSIGDGLQFGESQVYALLSLVKNLYTLLSMD